MIRSFARTTRPASTCVLLALFAFVCVSGCGEANNDPTVQGTVTYAGQLITDGALSFFPTSGRPTTVPLESDGTYTSQLAPGDYRVTVVVSVRPPAGWKEGDPMPKPAVELPLRYSSRAKTPLRATVAAGQTEPIDFALQ